MHTKTESAILEIARKHFVQKGFAGTRMQEIADEAQINKAMLHYYFRSKEKLYQEIIKQTLDTIIPTFAKALLHKGTFWEKVERVIDTYITNLIIHPEIPFFITSEISQRREYFIQELKKRAIFFPAAQEFMTQMMEGMQKGELREVPPVHLFLSIIGMTVFPFIAKPIYCTVFEFPSAQFDDLMLERKEFILDFVKHALKVR